MKKMPQNINLSLVSYVVKGRNFLNRIEECEFIVWAKL